MFRPNDLRLNLICRRGAARLMELRLSSAFAGVGCQGGMRAKVKGVVETWDHRSGLGTVGLHGLPAWISCAMHLADHRRWHCMTAVLPPPPRLALNLLGRLGHLLGQGVERLDCITRSLRSDVAGGLKVGLALASSYPTERRSFIVFAISII